MTETAAPGWEEGWRLRDGREIARRFVEVGGQPLAYVEEGEGPAVVLIHGALTALDDMVLALSERLRPRHRVIAIDRPGFGHSGRDRLSGAGVLRQAAIVAEGLDRIGVERPVIVGHSFGGTVAVAMAALRPETAGVVALAPLAVPEWRLEHWLFAPRAWPGLGPTATSFAHAVWDPAMLPVLWRGMFLPQPRPEQVERDFPFALAGSARATLWVGEDCLAAGPDLLALLPMTRALSAPLEVLGGDADIVVNNALHGRLLASLAPKGRYTSLPGIGHMIHHAAPDQVVAAIDRVSA